MFVQVFIIKEGVSYRIRIDFIVQREIVHGLRYVQKTYRLGVPGKTYTHTHTVPLLVVFFLQNRVVPSKSLGLLFGVSGKVLFSGFEFKLQRS
jgi:hypothetical protein